MTDSEVLDFLRASFARMDAKLDTLRQDILDLKIRVSALEQAVAAQSSRIDRIEIRLERIERRLDLLPAS